MTGTEPCSCTACALLIELARAYCVHATATDAWYKGYYSGLSCTWEQREDARNTYEAVLTQVLGHARDLAKFK